LQVGPPRTFDRSMSIAEQGDDLSINRYKEIVYEEVEHRPPLEIIVDLRALERTRCPFSPLSYTESFEESCDAGEFIGAWTEHRLV
jgi:hypothetical protein